MIKKLISFFQKDAVLTVSFFLAVLSCFFCPPGPQYLGYLDFHTLILLSDADCRGPAGMWRI